MGGDFRVLPDAEGLSQVLDGFIQAAQSVQDPAHAVQDIEVIRAQFQGFFDQVISLRMPVGGVGQGVSQRVERLGVIRFALEYGPEILFQQVEPAGFFRSHGPGI